MKFEKKRDLILNGNMNKVIITLATPLMLNNLIQTIYNLTDTFWVSKLGDIEVASITLVWPVVFFFMAIGMGVNIAGTALISQYVGSNQQEKATKVAGQIVTFSFLLSTLFALVGITNAHHFVGLMRGEGILLEKASAYLQIIFAGSPFMFVFFAFNSIKQGQGDTFTPMVLGGLSVGLNIILDPIFIFTFGLGIRGAAYATILARALFTFYAVYTLFTKNEGIRLKPSDLKLNKDLLIKIIKVGIPSSFGQSTTALGFGLLNSVIISYGANTLAAFGIGNRLNSVVMMPAMGIGAALATIIGQNLGADQLDRAKSAVRQSAILSTTLMVLGGIIMFNASPILITQFSQDQEVIRMGTYYLRLISLSLPLMGFFQIFVGTFQGSGHTISAMIIMAGRLWVFRIPMIFLFKYLTNFGSNGIWYAMNLSNLFICIVGLAIYSTGRWQTKIIKKRPEIIEKEDVKMDAEIEIAR